jgi:hypothetical protein
VNQIEGVCQDIERTINQTIQNTLNALERDCETIALLLDKRLEQDTADRNYNFKASGRGKKYCVVITTLLLPLSAGSGPLSTVTGDMLMLTVLFVLPEGFDIFKLGTIVTGGKKNLSGNLSFTKITLVGWMFGS